MTGCTFGPDFICSFHHWKKYRGAECWPISTLPWLPSAKVWETANTAVGGEVCTSGACCGSEGLWFRRQCNSFGLHFIEKIQNDRSELSMWLVKSHEKTSSGRRPDSLVLFVLSRFKSRQMFHPKFRFGGLFVVLITNTIFVFIIWADRGIYGSSSGLTNR